VEALNLDPQAYVHGRRTLQPFFGFRVGCIGGSSVVCDYGQPVSFGIRRWEFDSYLLERCGARVREGTPVPRLVKAHGDWSVGEASAPLVVGAGGHFCPVARHLNDTQAAGSLVVAQEVEFRLDVRARASCRVLPEVPEIYFSPDLEGYGWCVRKGDWLNVGLGRRAGGGLRAPLAEFLRWVTSIGRIPSDLPSRWRGHAYLLREARGRRIVDDGVLLVGDAAGLAAAQSGEGIGPAVESGLLAADAILTAAGRRREELLPYARALEERLGPRRAHHRLPTYLSHGLAPSLLAMPWFARHLVIDRLFLNARPAHSSRSHWNRDTASRPPRSRLGDWRGPQGWVSGAKRPPREDRWA
jgi:flavin-dependent dehydrogenase